jgi:hypothetical protein
VTPAATVKRLKDLHVASDIPLDYPPMRIHYWTNDAVWFIIIL